MKELLREMAIGLGVGLASAASVNVAFVCAALYADLLGGISLWPGLAMMNKALLMLSPAFVILIFVFVYIEWDSERIKHGNKSGKAGK